MRLVWRTGNIDKNRLFAAVLCIVIMVRKGTSSLFAAVLCIVIMVRKGTSSSYRSVDCVGL